MKTVDVRELQHHLGRYLDSVEAGETIEVRRRKRVIARIVPRRDDVALEPWPDYMANLSAIYPDGSIGFAASKQIEGDRGDR